MDRFLTKFWYNNKYGLGVNQKLLIIRADQGTTWYVVPALVTKIQLLQQEYNDNISRVAEIKWQKNKRKGISIDDGKRGFYFTPGKFLL